MSPPLTRLSAVAILSLLLGAAITYVLPLCKDCISVQIVNRTPHELPNVTLYFDMDQGVTGRFTRTSLSPGASTTFTIVKRSGGVPFRIEALDMGGKIVNSQRGYAYKDESLAIE